MDVIPTNSQGIQLSERFVRGDGVENFRNIYFHHPDIPLMNNSKTLLGFPVKRLNQGKIVKTIWPEMTDDEFLSYITVALTNKKFSQNVFGSRVNGVRQIVREYEGTLESGYKVKIQYTDQLKVGSQTITNGIYIVPKYPVEFVSSPLN